MSNETGSNTSGAAQSNVKQTSVDVSQLSSATDALASNAGKLGNAIQNVSAVMAAYNANLQNLVNSVTKIQEQTAAAMSLASAEDKVAAKGKEFIESLKQQAETLKMNKQEMLQYQAVQLGVSAQAAPFIEALGHTDENMNKLSFSSEATRKQLLGMAADVSKGNWDKLGDSLMGLAESTGLMKLALTPAGTAITLVAIAANGLFSAMAKGAQEQKAMNDALIMTGGYAGVTSDALNEMAHAAAASSGSLESAKKVVTELAGSGKFTGDQIGAITTAVVAMEHATGASIDQTVKDFQSLAEQTSNSSTRSSDAISSAVVKLNERYHFLTGSVYDQIRALEEEGKTREASKVATDAFAEATTSRSKKISEDLGYIANAWDGIKRAISIAGDELGEWGKKSTDASEVARIKKELAMLDRGGKTEFVDGVRIVQSEASILAQKKSLTEELVVAQDRLNVSNYVAKEAAERKVISEDAIQAKQKIRTMLLDAEEKKQDAVTVALNRYNELLKKIRADSTTEIAPEELSEKVIAATRAKIIEAYSPAKTGPNAAQLAEEKMANEARLRDIVNKGVADDIETERKLGAINQFEYERRMQQIALENIAYKKMQEEKILAVSGLTTAQKLQHENNIKALDAERQVTEKINANKALVDEKKERDDFIKSIVTEENRTTSSLNDSIAKQKQQNAELEKTLGLKSENKKLWDSTSLKELEASERNIQLTIEEGRANSENVEISEANLTQIKEKIKLLKILENETNRGGELAKGVAELEAAKKSKAAWTASSESIGELLYSAIDNGGGNAIKKIVSDLKTQFAHMVLKPLIAPIAAFGASLLNPSAASAKEVMGGGGENGFSLISAGKSLWDGVSSAMAGAGSVGTGFFGSLVGGLNGAGVGSGLTSSIGLNIGTSISSVVGPQLSGALASGLSGIAAAVPWVAAAYAIYSIGKAAFSMGDKQITGQNVTGSFGADGSVDASRNVSWSQKGGFLRSDRSGSWNYNLSNSTAIADGVAYQDTASLKSDQAIKKALEDSYAALKNSTEGYAKALGLNVDVIKSRTDEINFTIGKDQAETVANVQKMMMGIADSIADSLMPELSKFTQGTETSSATLARLAIDLSGTNEMFGKLGLKLFDLNEAGITSAEKLLTAAGGLQNLQQITSSYYDNFFSASEKEVDVRKALTAEFEKAGLGVLPKTRDGFRDMVTEISKTGTPEQIATLLKLSGAFASIVPAVVPVTEAVAAITDGVQKLNISTVFATTSNYMSIEDRLIEVKKRRAQEEELAAAAAASAQAMTELITAAQASIPALLRSGNVVAALAANMVGVFNDKTFSNDAAARFNAKASVKMAGQVSADALNTQDAGKVIGILLSQTLSDDFNESLATEVKNGLGVSMGNALSYALHGVFVTAGKMLALRDFAPQGPGIASVIAARNQFAFDSDAKTYRVANKADESITYYGKDIQAYKDGIESLNYALKTGRITQDEYASGMVIIDTVMKDAKELAGDLGAQLRRVGEDAQRLALSGMSSIGYYFGEISKAADALAVSAAAANTPLYQTETAIGRLTSLATVMGQSVSAVVDGLDAQIDSISKQMLLTQDEGQQRTLAGQLKSLQFDQAHITDSGSMVGNAAVIAQAASAAAAAMTTQDAKNAAAALSGNAAFSGVGGNQLRDMSLLLDGIKQLDPASFEAAFTRLNDALIKGRVNTAQYQALFEHGLDVFNNGAKEMVSAAQKMADVVSGLKQKADEAMTALAASVNAEKNAAKTVYDDKVKQINAEKTAAVAIYDASTKAINGQIASVNKTVETTRTIVSTLTSALEGMRMSSNLAADRKTAQNFLSNAVSTAQNGGGLPEDDKLKSALGVISQPSTDLFSSFEDYTRDFYVTAGDIAALNAVATPQLDAAQQSLITLNAQLDQAKVAQEQLLAELEKNATDAQLAYTIQTDYLDGLLTNAKAQLDTALGTNVAVLTLSAAMLQVTTSITALASAQAAQAAAQMAAAQATAAATAQAATQAKPAVLTGNVAAFATGGDTEGGLHLVGENGPELQLTGPSRIFTAAQTASMISGSASDELLSEIRKLRSAVENQDTAMNKIVSNTGATASSSAKTADAFGAGPVLVEIA